MGKARKGIVSVIVAVLVVYFMLGLVGMLPYQYDLIKQSTTAKTSTEFRIETSAWQEALSIPDGTYTDLRDIHEYEGSLYIGLYKTGGYVQIWKMSTAQTVTQVYEEQVYVAVDFIKFVDYYDEDGDNMLYCAISQGGYVPQTWFVASYDGITWEDHSTNAKIVPPIFTRHCTAVAVNGRYMAVGLSFQRDVYIKVWDAISWGFNSAKQMTTYDKYVNSMVVYHAPSPSDYETFYVGLEGNPYVGDAGVYYLNSADTWTGIISLQPYNEVKITAMHVFEDTLWMGTGFSGIYNWSWDDPSQIYEYASPTTPIIQIVSWGSYSGSLYFGTYSDVQQSNGGIYKKVGNDFLGQYSYGDIIFSFAEFNGKFYASSNGGKVHVYYSAIVYDAPIIMHNPISKYPKGQAINIEAIIADADGVDTAVLTYEVQGEIQRTKSMGIVAGTGTQDNGNWVNGTYRAEIPAINELKNVSYYITATDNDGNVTQTSVYVIEIVEPSFFGLDYRILYLIAIGLTLGLGYVAYGRDREKPSKWSKRTD